MPKQPELHRVKLQKTVVGGQTIADLELENGQLKKAFIWGGLPGEEVEFTVTKKRAGIVEGIVNSVLTSSKYRVKPEDEASYLSTSPWQIYDWDYENQQKSELAQMAFSQHQIDIPLPTVITDNQTYHYRNKMEFTWWWNNQTSKLELANYKRGAKGKIAVDGSSLAIDAINTAARRIRDLLNQQKIEAYDLKTLLIRSTKDEQIVAQLYVTRRDFDLGIFEFESLKIKGLEIIYSNPKSPASVITKRLYSYGDLGLVDIIVDKTFNYPAESFFQINLPVYELAIADIRNYLLPNRPIVDLYSGVGTIGLSLAGQNPVTLIEINPEAVDEMKRNIVSLGLKNSQAVLSPAELALEYIVADCQLIVDPPRAGMHKDVVDKILAVCPEKIIYLSCNPATQARDVKLLLAKYELEIVKVFNFFPRTPHIESLAVLMKKLYNKIH